MEETRGAAEGSLLSQPETLVQTQENTLTEYFDVSVSPSVESQAPNPGDRMYRDGESQDLPSK